MSVGPRWPLRLWHNYLGMLIAPSLVFFSLTGAVQMLDLHEGHRGYRAPALLVEVASVHKDQILPDDLRRAGSDDPAPRYTARQTLLKAYWIGVAGALVISTLLGVVLALRNRLHRRTALVLLVVGTLVPLGLALA